MDELVDDSRIVAPFLPSLSHISTVKVALSLFNEFGGVNSNITLREIQTGNTAASIVCFEEKGERKFKTTKKNLAFIPELLRKKVLEAAEGLIHTVRYWKVCNATFFNLKRGEFVIHWRSDGTIDTVKTVQQLVLDESINIRKRFEIACKYGLERNIRILWAEMQPSDQTENFDTAYNYLEQFWVRWMRHGSRVPWMQEASEYFKHARGYFSTGFTRFNWFFSYLQPGDRQKFLKEMEFAEDDDLRLCLHAMTKEEEEKILKANVALVLLNCLRWPLQNLFLETVQKTWKYIDESKFKVVLFHILDSKDSLRDFDYCELLEIFWNRSPSHLKESTKEDPHLRVDIDSCLDEMRRKREAGDKSIDLCLDEIRRKRENDLCLDEKRRKNESFNNERLYYEQKVNYDTKRKRKAIRKNRGWHSKKQKKN